MRQGLFRTASLAGGAMLFAHWLAYVLSYADPHARAHVLAETGHGYWLYAAAIALAVATYGFGALVRTPVGLTTRRAVAMRLASFQVAGFVALEATERVVTGHGLLDVFAEPVLWIGIVVQIAVAIIGAWLVRNVARLVARLRRPRIKPAAVADAPVSRLDVVRLLDPSADPLSRRGPPILV